MPHIHTADRQHDLTASAFIIRTDFAGPAEPKLMLHWHKKLKQYLQFGGHVELGENPWQAIAHELREESGYELGDLLILQPADRLKSISGSILHPQPIAMNTHGFPPLDYTHWHTDIEYVFVANGPPKHAVEAGESEKFTCFSAAELRALPPAEVIENVREVGLHALMVCYPKWEQVDPAIFQLENLEKR